MKYVLLGVGFFIFLSIILASSPTPSATVVDVPIEVEAINIVSTENHDRDVSVGYLEEIEEDNLQEAESQNFRPNISARQNDFEITSINPPSLILSDTQLAVTPPVTELHQVLRVIDGDTIEVMYGGIKRTVRYIGVDTPETVHPNKPVECMGKEASAFNKNLIEGKSARLERDVSDVDKYGRLLRYVYVGDVMVNEVLVAEGYANVITYPPDVKHTELFRGREQEAREAKKGLWGDACANIQSSATSSASPILHVSQSDASCRIKGNISSNGEKIFHSPGCKSYEKTVISESAGERWFCSEQEAVAAGWRKALNCS